MAALCARVNRIFPIGDRQPAIDAFIESAKRLPEPRPALLDALMKAGDNGPFAFVDRATEAAVVNGASVAATTERYGITEAPWILELEKTSVDGPAGDAVRNGASVAATKKIYGITDAGSTRKLEKISANESAGAA